MVLAVLSGCGFVSRARAVLLRSNASMQVVASPRSLPKLTLAQRDLNQIPSGDVPFNRGPIRKMRQEMKLESLISHHLLPSNSKPNDRNAIIISVPHSFWAIPNSKFKVKILPPTPRPTSLKARWRT